MLEKVISIDNIGVIKKGALKPVDLQKVSLIYADNARGKSTLSSLLLACSVFDAQEIIRRKTIGATTPQRVVFRFAAPAGSNAFNAEFDGSEWKGRQPNLHVFNQAFVDQNVYASAGVLPEHREALLNLALGNAAVAQRAKFDSETVAVRECGAAVTAAESALQGYRGHLSITEFTRLTPVVTVDEQLLEIERQITEARASHQIVSRPHFKKTSIPQFRFDGIPELLQRSFESISMAAEETANAHFAKHNGSSTERWVAEGLNHKPEQECPFCGQSTADLHILKAYKTYFDGSYTEYQKQIKGIRPQVLQQLGGHLLTDWQSSDEFNLGLQSVWAESLGITAVPTLNHDWALDVLRKTEAALLEVISFKENDPLTALNPTSFLTIVSGLDVLTQAADDFNRQIDDLNTKIATYKAAIAEPDLAQLESIRTTLNIAKQRFEPKVTELVAKLGIARASVRTAEGARDAARTELDRLMAQTLETFQGSINGWLRKFAAPFEIDDLGSTHRGGGLRSEYVLKVRGATVIVGPTPGGDLAFHAALSEGDKRTLAFAFFLARLFADPLRASATVVLDDVFTSLDKHRRHNTIEAVMTMVSECSQIIALGHDAHFLREVKRRVNRKQLAPVGEFALLRDGSDHSRLDVFDLDEYCSSEYYRHYELVERFIDGDRTVNLLEVAKALRLLVEGHLHRCFPKKFKEGQTVGEMLGQVKAAVPPSPLARLRSLHAELVSFNEFAAAFHHDTSGGYPRIEINEAELLPFARGALGFIQMRSFQTHVA